MTPDENQDKNQGKPAETNRSLGTWFTEMFSRLTHGSAPEQERPVLKNRAIMKFDSLPLGKILSPAKNNENDQIELQISIPVNLPTNQSGRREFVATENILSQKALRALDSALFLVEQAVEYDRYCQRRMGAVAIRDQALKPFRDQGPIKSFEVIEGQEIPVRIDLNRGTVTVDSLAFRDYFYLVRSVLSAGAQFELRSDETRGREASQHSTCAMVDSLVSSRLAMITRYTEHLESGSDQDRIAWKTALDFHAADIKQTQILMEIASELSKIRDACANSYFTACKDHRIDSETNKSYQNLYREITLAIHELKLDVAISYFQFNTDENAAIEYIIGFKEALSEDSDGVPSMNFGFLESLPASSVSITSPEGRDKLIQLVSDSHSLWYSGVHFTFEQFIETFSEKITGAIESSEKCHKSLASYLELFSS